MPKKPEPPASKRSSEKPVLSTLTFREADLEGPIRDLTSVDPHELRKSYSAARVAAEAAGEEEKVFVFRFLEDLTGIGLNPDDRGAVWHPMLSIRGRRTMMPEDLASAQIAALLELLPDIHNPGLRARVADVVWSRDRRAGAAAKSAVEAYSECAESLLESRFTLWDDQGKRVWREAVIISHRALQIAYATSKKGQLPERPIRALLATYEATKVGQEFSAFEKAAGLALYYGLKEPKEVAADSEALASSFGEDDYPGTVAEVWRLGSRLYENIGDEEGRQRCLKGQVQQTLAMRKGVTSASAEAHWIMEALQLLRHIKGMEETEAQLEVELRRLQKESLKEMGSFSVKLKLEPIVEAVTSHFEKCDLPQALLDFVLLDESRDPNELRKEALATLHKAPFMSMMSFAHVDDEGRTAAKSPGASLSEGEPDAAWYARSIGQSEHYHRVTTVRGQIIPARRTIQGRFGITERTLAPIVAATSVVPASQKALVALGLARFFQGDLMSATHLLVPQLEPMLRHLLRLNGYDPAKRRDDATEEDLSLSGLFERMRQELDAILGHNLSFEIDMLFNQRPGPAIRHELAHGQISAGACFSDDIYYANWMFYRLIALPVAANWDTDVRPAIEADFTIG